MAKQQNSGGAVKTVEALARPVVEGMGLRLWDVRFEKEGPDWFLRILIDRDEPLDTDTCEAVSRAIDPLLDEADPIEGSYTLEVGSAGAERALKRPADFQRYLGSPVLVKLYRNQDGSKEFAGTLHAYDASSGDVTITVGGIEKTFAKKDVALVRLRAEF